MLTTPRRTHDPTVEIFPLVIFPPSSTFVYLRLFLCCSTDLTGNESVNPRIALESPLDFPHRLSKVILPDHTIPTISEGGMRSWIGRKIHLYNVTMGLYMLDWWERYLFNILMVVLLWFISYNGSRSAIEFYNRFFGSHGNN